MVTTRAEARGESLALHVGELRHGYRINGVYRSVLHELDLRVEPGEFVALLGPSGCGKSTLLRLIAGLEKPDVGWIEVDGKPVTGPGPDRIVMFQDSTLYPWRTVKQNVALSQDISGRRNDAQVSEAIRLVGLTGFENMWPHQLSGGMAQRVALARALVNHPRMLLLDEPLGKLDALTRLTMQNELYRLWKERGFTTLMVTHDVEEAIFLATRIVTLGGDTYSGILSDMKINAEFPRRRNDPYFVGLREEILEQLGYHAARDA